MLVLHQWSGKVDSLKKLLDTDRIGNCRKDIVAEKRGFSWNNCIPVHTYFFSSDLAIIVQCFALYDITLTAYERHDAYVIADIY